MRFSTICTILSLLAAPLTITAAPAPAAAALANPEPHGRHGGGYKKRPSFGSYQKEEGQAQGTDSGFNPQATGTTGTGSVDDDDSFAGSGSQATDVLSNPIQTLLPGGNGNANANANGNLGAGVTGEEEVVDESALGEDASVTTTASGPVATD